MQKNPYKQNVYLEFVTWSALPPFERASRGMPDQGDFAKAFNVNKDTLTRWKSRPEFEKDVDRLLKNWGRGKTPDIIQSIYRSAMKGNAKSQRFWIEYFGGSLKPVNSKETKSAELLREGDIRQLITFLPEWMQEKYNKMLHDLSVDTSIFLNINGPSQDMTEAEFEEYKKDNPTLYL